MLKMNCRNIGSFNRYVIISFTFILNLLCFQLPVHSADVENPWHLSMYGGGVFPTDDTIEETFTIGGRFTYELLENLEVGVDLSWQQYEDKYLGLTLGDVNHIPVYAVVKYNIVFNPDNTRFVPYLLGGIGFSYWNYHEELSTISADDDISFTGKIGGGVDMALNEQTSLFLEGGFSWAKYDLSGTVQMIIPVSSTPIVRTVSVSSSTDLNTAFAKIGIRINF